MKKVILIVIFIFSFTIFVHFAEAEEKTEISPVGKTVDIGLRSGKIVKKTIVLASEDGEISLELLSGFLISLDRLPETWVYNKHPIIILRHSTTMAGNKTGTTDLGDGAFQFYGHFCDGKRDISEKLYKGFQK